MKLRPVLASLSAMLCISSALSDDFVKLASRKIWKVQECRRDGNFFKVKRCFSDEYCKDKNDRDRRYRNAEYSCLPSYACGRKFLAAISNTKDANFAYIKEYSDGILLSILAPYSSPQIQKVYLALPDDDKKVRLPKGLPTDTVVGISRDPGGIVFKDVPQSVATDLAAVFGNLSGCPE